MAELKEMKGIIKAALEQGFRVEQGTRMHYKFFSPDKSAEMVVTSFTPGDRRALKNIQAKLKRAGLRL